jgi:hypothetical protein
VPEARIAAFLYVRYQPAFPLSQGGVVVFQGMDNLQITDVAYLDYEMTMPWPTVDGNVITTANGLRIEFLEPGRVARVTYTSPDGQTSLDVTATGVTPLLRRGHVMPGEEAFHRGAGSIGDVPGGSEQFMHVTGELVLDGERHVIDCHAPRDRSWRQVRKETRDMPMPPVGWSPMYFGEDLVFNQISYEHPDTDPAWAGVYDVPADRPTHHFAWLQTGDQTKEIVRVRRNVLERQPGSFVSIRQEIEAEDEDGAIHRFAGEAIAVAPIPAWPNVAFHDTLYRWEDERGRVAYSTFQEIWFDRYQRAMAERARLAGGVR